MLYHLFNKLDIIRIKRSIELLVSVVWIILSCIESLPMFRDQVIRLDYIGQIEVDMGKVEYEGTLDQLLENDIDKFIEYNLVDVKIVVALEEKLKLIDLARAVSHMGRIPYEEVYFSSRYIEGVMLTYLRKLNLVAPSKRHDASYDDSVVGSVVLM